ncbi:Scd6-like Sm domain-containing protein [Hysterangium stoloniferum]|nr:Scd6-like Sm domain-containing protein [Hysterangium stoloniferum]
MASYIGKTISLLSQSDIRYRGILHSIDATQATIQLSNVYSMGTETRRPESEFIPPQDTPYEFILFRAQEVKDLKVDATPLPPPPMRNVHSDPAVIGVSQGTPAGQTYNNYPNAYNPNVVAPPPTVPVQVAPAAASVPSPPEPPAHASTSQHNRRREANGRHPHNPNAVRSAAASLENVERAMGDLRVGDAPRNSRRNVMSNDEIQAGNIQVPAADFDFQSSNAKFDKVAAKPAPPSDSEGSDEDTNPSDAEAVRKEKEKEKKEAAYNPSKSFFDSLTPNSLGPRGGLGGGQAHPRGGAGRGRGRGYGRSRREEEAQRNLITFGEAIPPSHGAGWGGRRGSGRRGSYPSQTGMTNGRPG